MKEITEKILKWQDTHIEERIVTENSTRRVPRKERIILGRLILRSEDRVKKKRGRRRKSKACRNGLQEGIDNGQRNILDEMVLKLSKATIKQKKKSKPS